MTAPDCLFCKIIQGQIPCIRIFEDDATLVFMDIMPQSDGHMLVVPKQHGANIWDIDQPSAMAIMTVGQRLSLVAKNALQAAGVSLMQLNGAAAGQTVFHVHLHIIPRWAGSDLRMHAREQADRIKLVAIAEKIKAGL